MMFDKVEGSFWLHTTRLYEHSTIITRTQISQNTSYKVNTPSTPLKSYTPQDKVHISTH